MTKNIKRPRDQRDQENQEVAPDEISIRLRNIPLYLRESDYYRGLNLADDDEISLPAKCFKVDTSVTNFDELENLLGVMRFWGVNVVPIPIVQFFYDKIPAVFERLVSEFPELEIITQLEAIISEPENERLKKAISFRNIDLVKGLLACGLQLDADSVDDVVKSDFLPCLQMIIKEHPELIDANNINVRENRGFEGCEILITYPCRAGNLSMLNILVDLGIHLVAHAWQSAMVGNHEEILEYLKEKQCPCDKDSVYFAARAGRIDMIKYFQDLGVDFIDTQVAAHAIHGGQLNTLQYLLEEGCPLTEEHCQTAARNDQLEFLQFLHEQGCPWDAETCVAAIEGNSLECLHYAHENGCEWFEDTSYEAAKYGNLLMLRYLIDEGCAINEGTVAGAASFGNLDCLQFLMEQGIPFDYNAVNGAAAYGELSILQFLSEQGIEAHLATTATELAAQNGHLPCLAFLLEKGCPVNKRASEAAATYGYPHIIEYLRVQGRSLVSESCMTLAARYNHLSTVIYLHRTAGVKWDEQMFLQTSSYDVFEYAMLYNCPFPSSELQPTAKSFADFPAWKEKLSQHLHHTRARLHTMCA